MNSNEHKPSKIDLIKEAEGFNSLRELADDIDEKSQQLNNWKMRGISKNGARKLNKKYGYTIESLLDDDKAIAKNSAYTTTKSQQHRVEEPSVDYLVSHLHDLSTEELMSGLTDKQKLDLFRRLLVTQDNT